MDRAFDQLCNQFVIYKDSTCGAAVEVHLLDMAVNKRRSRESQ